MLSKRMFFATDVHYDDARGIGPAALVVFEQWTSPESFHELVQIGVWVLAEGRLGRHQRPAGPAGSPWS